MGTADRKSEDALFKICIKIFVLKIFSPTVEFPVRNKIELTLLTCHSEVYKNYSEKSFLIQKRKKRELLYYLNKYQKLIRKSVGKLIPSAHKKIVVPYVS